MQYLEIITVTQLETLFYQVIFSLFFLSATKKFATNNTVVTCQNTENSCCSRQYIPEYQVNTKECKHDNAVANYPGGITDLVEQEEPFVHQSTGVKGRTLSEA